MKNFIKLKLDATVSTNDTYERVNIKNISSYSTKYDNNQPITVIKLTSGNSFNTNLLSSELDKLIEDAQK